MLQPHRATAAFGEDSGCRQASSLLIMAFATGRTQLWYAISMACRLAFFPVTKIRLIRLLWSELLTKGVHSLLSGKICAPCMKCAWNSMTAMLISVVQLKLQSGIIRKSTVVLGIPMGCIVGTSSRMAYGASTPQIRRRVSKVEGGRNRGTLWSGRGRRG